MKAAPVDLITGTLTAERYKIVTPQPATPRRWPRSFARLVEHFEWEGKVGVAFPAVVRNGVARTAANIDKSWIGTDIDAVFTEASGQPVHVINDADAAGLAEMRYGAGRQRRRRHHADVRHGDRLGPVPRRQARAEHRARPPLLDGEEAEHRAAAVVRDRESCRGRSGASASTATSSTSSSCSHPTC